jgi:hypothetical protein
VAQRAGDAHRGQAACIVHRPFHTDDGIEAQQCDRHGRVFQIHLPGPKRVDDGGRERVDIHLEPDGERRSRIHGGEHVVHPQHAGPELLVAKRVEAETCAAFAAFRVIRVGSRCRQLARVSRGGDSGDDEGHCQDEHDRRCSYQFHRPYRSFITTHQAFTVNRVRRGTKVTFAKFSGRAAAPAGFETAGQARQQQGQAR